MIKFAFLIISAFFFPSILQAQILELFGGNQRATQDIMFFKFFLLPKTAEEEAMRSDVLFFFRGRASVDYRMTDTKYLPQFGLTSAISYNPPVLKGFAPVVVGQIFSNGMFPKAGVQFAVVKKQGTVFTWIVCETRSHPSDIDFFLLANYMQRIAGFFGLFYQVESANAFATSAKENYSFTQRLRIGVQFHRFQIGPAADLVQIGNNTFTNTFNIGGFVRYDF